MLYSSFVSNGVPDWNSATSTRLQESLAGKMREAIDWTIRQGTEYIKPSGKWWLEP